MIKKILIASLLFLGACISQKPAIDPDRKVTRKEDKLAIGEVTQTLNITYRELFPLIQEVFANRKIPIAKVDSNYGRLTTASLPMQDRVCSVNAKSSMPLNCEVIINVSSQPYRQNTSKLIISYTEECDGLESKDLKCPDSKAEKLMLSIVSDIKRYAGIPN